LDDSDDEDSQDTQDMSNLSCHHFFHETNNEDSESKTTLKLKASPNSSLDLSYTDEKTSDDYQTNFPHDWLKKNFVSQPLGSNSDQIVTKQSPFQFSSHCELSTKQNTQSTSIDVTL